jgi:SAM-dependent methyltransferase
VCSALADRPILTPHFRVSGSQVTPMLRAEELDNGIVDLLMSELFPLGLIADQQAFERLFVETVLGAAADEELAWSAFYRNTLRGLDEARGEGAVAVFSRIYRRAASLTRGGSLLDLGSGFGFFALQQSAASLAHVVGCDASAAAVSMASRAGARLASGAGFVTADGLRLPFGAGCFDVVCVIHLIEHLLPEATLQLVAEARRVARKRVVLAVPIEAIPQRVFGHRQAFTLASLARLGEAITSSASSASSPSSPSSASGHDGWCFEVSEADGGWMVLDRHPEGCAGS